MLTAVYALLFYFATAVFVVGLAIRVYQYAKTPAPLKIPTTPAPVSKSGVWLRMAREVVLFESLFRSNKWIWLFGIAFHGALAVVVVRHLRYFLPVVPEPLVFIQPIGVYAGFAMVGALAVLWARRIVLPRMRYISAPSDHLMLVLLLAIGGSGLGMKFVAHTDIVSLKAFTLGLMTFNWQPLPPDPLVLVHLGLVALLMIIFPFSKLLHAPGLFFSPTRNQVDNPARAASSGTLGRETRSEGMSAVDQPTDKQHFLDPLEVPQLAPCMMAESKPYVAAPQHQEPLGFPGKLVDNWQEVAIAKMGELLGKYRSLRVYMDACVKCGSCTDKCHYFLGTGDPKNMPVARADLMRKVYRRYFTFAGKILPLAGGRGGSRRRRC